MSDAIREAMREAGFKSARALSKRIGVHETTISKWLNGVDRPSDANLRKLAEALKVDPTWARIRFEETGPDQGDNLKRMAALQMRHIPGYQVPNTQDHDIVTPGFPPVPQVPDLSGVLDGEHLTVREQLRDLAGLARGYLDAVEGRIRSIDNALAKGEHEGRIDERAVRVQYVETVKRGKPNSLSWGRLDNFFAGYETKCPSCETLHVIHSDLRELRDAVKESLGRTEDQPVVNVEFEPASEGD